MRQQRTKQTNWGPPVDWWTFFSAASDEVFKARHPIGYGFLVMLGIVALLAPGMVFVLLVGSGSGWAVLGAAGGLVFGVGLFNYVARVIGQFLGHGVSAAAFLIGGGMMLVSWLLCR